MYNYYLIRRCGKFSIISAAVLPSHIPCEVVGSCSFSAPLSLDEASSMSDILNSRDV